MGQVRQLKKTLDVYSNAASSTIYLQQMTLLPSFHISKDRNALATTTFFVVIEYCSFLLNHFKFFSVLTKALGKLACIGQDESFSCDGAVQVPV